EFCDLKVHAHDIRTQRLHLMKILLHGRPIILPVILDQPALVIAIVIEAPWNESFGCAGDEKAVLLGRDRDVTCFRDRRERRIFPGRAADRRNQQRCDDEITSSGPCSDSCYAASLAAARSSVHIEDPWPGCAIPPGRSARRKALCPRPPDCPIPYIASDRC